MSQPVLRMFGIDKRFGPVIALASVDFSLERGEVHALLGVNGAGKSTLVKIRSEAYTKDAGLIEIDGQPRSFGNPRDAVEAGIASVQQHPEPIGDLSGYDNIFIGQESASRGLFRRVDHADMERRPRTLLRRFPASPSRRTCRTRGEAAAGGAGDRRHPSCCPAQQHKGVDPR